MKILAVDPGPSRSALLGYDSESCAVADKAILENPKALYDVRHLHSLYDHLAVEMIASYGMPVGCQVFDTCVWIGRFLEAWKGKSFGLIYRREVKLHLCQTARAKDGNVRQALIDRFGPGRERAIGRKKQPGPLYGVSKDLWAALGVAVTVGDRAK